MNMIAKSFLIALLISGAFSFSVSGKSGNKYQRILEEYDIHPPGLEYGYPVWYSYDTLPVTAIIFLKKNLEVPLEKIDSITYVAEPTEENAEVILYFSGAYSIQPKFYVVPDSSLSFREVKEFLEALTPWFHTSTVLFCGSQGRYYPVFFEDMFWLRSCYIPPGLGWNTSVFTVMIDCSNEVLAESQVIPSDSLYYEVHAQYISDYGTEDGYYGFFRNKFTVEDCEDLLARIRKNLDRESDPGLREYYEKDLQRASANLALTKKFGTLFLLSRNAFINLRMQEWCNHSIASYYEQLNQVCKGVLMSREWRALQISTLHYSELMLKKRWQEVDHIQLEFPDLIRYSFCKGSEDCFSEPPPLPEVIIPEDDIEIQESILIQEELLDSSKSPEGW
jgi:hypothetical protein